VFPYLGTIYYELLKHAHGNDRIITLHSKNYTVLNNKDAALITILKVQQALLMVLSGGK